MNTPRSRIDQQTAEQQLTDGLTKHAATLGPLTILGTVYKVPDVITILQSLITSAKTVVASRASWQTDVAADQDLRTKYKTFLSGIRQSVRLSYGNSIETLADFGLSPHKAPPVRTPEQKKASADKAAATRAARHTLGKKQKAQIKGTPVATTPVDAPKVQALSPTQPAASPTPATPTPPVTTHS